MADLPANDLLQLSHLAEEIRVLADSMTDPGAKEAMLGIAETYDAIIKRAGKQAKP